MDSETPSWNDRCPLHVAADDNNVEELERILESGHSDVNVGDHLKRTVLHCLLDKHEFDDIEILKRVILLLRDHGCDINAQDSSRRTPLHYVFSTYQRLIPDIIRFCYKNFPSADPFVKSKEGFTVLHTFMSDMGEDAKEREDVNDMFDERELFIQDFIKGEIAQSELDIQNLLNDRENSGYSVFQTYIGGEMYTITSTKLMIQHGADVNSSSSLGITPVMQAALLDRCDVLDVLLQSGANVNGSDIFGQTALFRVRSHQSLSLLCDYGAQLDKRDRFGKMALSTFQMFKPENLPYGGISITDSLSRYRPLAEWFFSRGIEPNTTDKHGSALLHYAAWWGDPQIIQFLLHHGACKNLRDNNNRTAYDLAEYHGNFGIANLLLPDNYHFNEEAARNYQETTKYCRIVIHHAQAEDMENALKEVGFSDDPVQLAGLLIESPVFGLTNRKEEAMKIKSAVDTLMLKTSAAVADLDFRFRSTVRQTGSSSEGTMIGDPCEFDYVFCLDFFAEECEFLQPDDLLNSGFGHMKIRNKIKNHPLSDFVQTSGLICSDEVRTTFEDIVVATLNTAAPWDHENIYFDGLMRFPSDKPVLQLQIVWHGSVYKQLDIKIDIVTGIYMDSWLPREIKDSDFINHSLGLGRLNFFLLFHGPNNCSDRVRISSAPSEIQFMGSTSEFFRECYALTKILKYHNFCPCVQFDDSIFSDDESDSDEESGEDSDEDVVREVYPISNLNNPYNYDKTGNQLGGYKQFENPNLIQSVYGWLVEIDESKRVRKLYTPKSGSADETKITKTERNTMVNDFSRIERSECDKKIHSEKRRQHKVKYERTFSRKGISEERSSTSDKSAESPTSMQDATERQKQDDDMERKLQQIQTLQDMESAQKKTFQEQRLTLPNKVTNDYEEQPTQSSTDVQEAQLIENNVCDDISWKGGDVMEAEDEITSYMLKNSLMHILSRTIRRERGEKSHVEVAISVYEYLHECAEKGCLRAFFMPYINIFSYVDEHIKTMEKEEVDQIVQKRCFRIVCFCKVILGILKQKHTDKQVDTS